MILPNLCTARSIRPVIAAIAEIDRASLLALTPIRIAAVGTAPLPKGGGGSGRRPRVLLPLLLLHPGGAVGVVHVVGDGRLAGYEGVVREPICGHRC